LRRVRDEDLAALDLSRMQSMFVGSEPVDAALARRFLDRFAAAGLRPDVLTGAYGLAESVVGITRGDPALGLAIDRVDRGALGDGVAEPAAPDHADAIELVCAGTVIEGHELAIMDELGAPLPDRRVGEIWTRGPSVMRGYWGRDDASAEVLVHDDPAGTWLRTGDLGYTVGGRLYVCGRLKELIIVRGKNHHPEDLERAAERVPGVRPGQSVAFSVPSPSGAEQVVLVCETLADDTDALARQVKREVAARTGVKVTHVTFQPPHTLPKTTSGKRQRRLVRTTWMRHAS
jgi:fatty-acyl-CoA synthase